MAGSRLIQIKDVRLRNVRNIQVRNDERFHVHVCTESDVENDLTLGTPAEGRSEKIKTSAIAVQPMEIHTTEGKERTIESPTVKQRKEAYCCKVTPQVGTRESKIYVDHNVFLLLTLNIERCLPKMVPIALNERVLKTEQYPSIAVYGG